MPQLIVLGSGTSTGIPMVGCHCPVCTSTDPHDQRLRTSILLQTRHHQNILIDTTPDLRTQLLRAHIEKVDAAIITHVHADHLHGIDDLRPLGFKQEKKIPLYTDEVTSEFLRQKFPYIFKERTTRPLGGGIPRLALCSFGRLSYPANDEGDPAQVNDAAAAEFRTVPIGPAEFTFFSLPHGHLRTNGFYHDGLAYLTDCHRVRPAVRAFLKAQKLKLLIIECLQPHPHDTHLGLAQTQEVIEDLNPPQVGLIHIAHSFSHQGLSELMAAWRPQTFPLYDEQILSWDV